MSRRCNEVVEQAYFYLDDEMSWFARVRVRRHLKRCSPCLSSFDFEAAFKTMVREKCAEEPNPELIDRLRALLREHGSDETAA